MIDIFGTYQNQPLRLTFRRLPSAAAPGPAWMVGKTQIESHLAAGIAATVSGSSGSNFSSLLEKFSTKPWGNTKEANEEAISSVLESLDDGEEAINSVGDLVDNMFSLEEDETESDQDLEDVIQDIEDDVI